MTDTKPTLSRGALRAASESESAAPSARITAAAMLIETFGATARNVRVAKRVAKTFLKYTAESERTQLAVRYQAEKLLARIERAVEAEEVVVAFDPDELKTEDAPDGVTPIPTVSGLVGGTHLLPPDDPFWDQPIAGTIRRRLFYRSWGFDESLTHGEIVAALNADSARLESRTLRRQPWACPTQQLDEQFERDTDRVRTELALRQLPDDDTGREELARQLAASGPRYEFVRPTFDPDGSGLPIVVLSANGRMLVALEFTITWPRMRATHQPL